MLREALAYALTPAPAWARRAGLLHQAIALEARYRRCRTAWAAHYAQCRAWVERAVSEVEPGGTVAVLGSGYGFDLPWTSLLARFQRVLLVDAIHPWAVRWRAWRQTGLVCLTCDLSGQLDPNAGSLVWPADTRLVLSMNVLGQLPLALSEGGSVRQAVIVRHLALLRQAEVSLLISDTGWQVESAEGELEIIDPWCGVPHPATPPVAQWAWEVAPWGEIRRGVRQVNAVSAWILRNAAD